MKLTQQSVLVRTEALPSTVLEESRVFLDIESGDYLSLSGTAKAAWELLASPLRIETLIARLGERYEVDSERCAAELLPFLEELLASGLLRETPESLIP